MRLEQLKYLLDVAETHSISSTAHRFFTSQQSVSSNLKQLEIELNTQLLNRSATGVTLTPHGMSVLVFAQRVLSDYEKLTQQLSSEGNTSLEKTSEQLTIASASYMAKTVLPNVIDIFRHHHPNVSIRIINFAAENLLNTTAAPSFDLAIVSSHTAYFNNFSHDDCPFARENLLNDEIIVCLSAHSPLAAHNVITIDDLREHICTFYSAAPLNEKALKYCRNILCATEDLDFHKKMLLQNDALTLMPAYAFGNFFSGKKFISKPFAVKIPITHGILWPRAKEGPLLEDLKMLISHYLHKK